MGPIFEGDGWFCVIAIIVSELLADIPWLSDPLRLPGIVMISLIFALFYGPEPKRISKKSFRGRSSGPYGCFAAWRTGRKFYWKRYLNRSAGKSDLNEKNMRAHEKGTLIRGCLHFISLSCKRRIKLSQRDRILSRKCIHTSCGSRR